MTDGARGAAPLGLAGIPSSASTGVGARPASDSVERLKCVPTASERGRVRSLVPVVFLLVFSSFSSSSSKSRSGSVSASSGGCVPRMAKRNCAAAFAAAAEFSVPAATDARLVKARSR